MTRIETEIEGVVSAVSQKDGRYAVKVGEQWHGGFGRCPVERGSSVLLRFYEKGEFKNIVSIRSTDAPLNELDMEELAQRFRERTNRVALECLEDAPRLLKECGVPGIVTPRNVSEFARELYARRAMHFSRFVEEFRRHQSAVTRPASPPPAASVESKLSRELQERAA